MSLFRGKTTVNRADKISDFTVATAEYGSAVPEILGTTRTSGNVIYYDDFTAHEHKETQRAGKGGGSKTVTITYTYTAAIIFALCEGPIKGMGKVWIDKEIHTYPSDKIGMTLFYGTDSQEPWPYVVGKHPEKALPYTGLAYMAGVIDLGNNASLPNFNFEVKGKLTETGDGVDVNPADYILYILNKIGMGDINIAGIENYRAYCKAADLLISTPSDDTAARTAREIVNEIATLTNAYIFWSNDQFKIVPLADRPVGNWGPNKTIMYDLTPDDLLEQAGGACVTYQRKDSSEIYNRFTVEFLNRANGYEKESVSYEDTEDIQLYGLRQASTTKAHYVYTKKRAVYLAQELARKNKYERNKYTFKLDWAFCRLEVGDLVTLTDPSIGLEKQVALIDSVQEDKNGILTYTAVSRAGEDFGEAIYSVHDTERPYIDFSPEPGDVDAPAIFQPPTELTSNGNELWIGAKGKSPNWGGCNVWISDNNENYILAGKITSSARLGTLAAAITKDADALEVAINGTLLSGSALDAERANTLCWIDGECLSYTTATMLQNGNYELSGLVRGQYNTAAAAHGQGAKFARCDETLLKTPLKKEDIGKKLWLKFTSYNIFGAQEQSLADVDAYEYTVTAYYIPPVLNLSAHNRYRELQDGVSRYDIVVDWETPDFANYLEGNVWYKTSSGQGDALTFEEGIAGDRQGYNGPWIFGGSGKNQVVIPQAIVGDIYLLACTTKDRYGESNSPDLAPQTELLVALKTTTPNTPDGFGITFANAAILSWEEVTNADILFYEVRYNQDPGNEDSMLLARTNGTSMEAALNKRQGTLYLYAKSAIGKYSAPATLKYNKPQPPKPKAPVLSSKLGAIAVSTGAIPSDCKGMNIYINDSECIFSANRIYTYSCPAGVYIVKIAYVDIFGEGPLSESSSATIKTKVDNDLLENEAISIEKVNSDIKDKLSQVQTNADDLLQLAKDTNSNFAAVNQSLNVINSTIVANKNAQDSINESLASSITQTAESINSTIVANKNAQDSINESLASSITQNADSITAVVTELGKSPELCAYSAITQLNNNVNLRVHKDNIIAQINLSPETITIDGKLLHITGDTLIDGNIITHNMLQAGCIDVTNLKAENFALSGEMAISGGSVRLDENGLKVSRADGGYTIFNNAGVLFCDSNNNTFSQIGRLMIGTAKHNDYVKFNNEWDIIPTVIVIPQNLQTSVASYSTSDLSIDCSASEITKSGFRVNCFTTLKSGTTGTQALNLQVFKFATDDDYVAVTNNAITDGAKSWSTTYNASAPSTSSKFDVSCTISVNSNETRANNRFNTVAKVEILVNDNIVASSGWIPRDTEPSNGSGNELRVWSRNIALSCSYTPGSTIKVRFTTKAVCYTSSSAYKQYNLIGVINSVKFDVASPVVIDQGVATFIVTDGNTAAYTTE